MKFRLYPINFLNFGAMKTIFLIGYMASGKTTFGRALSSERGIPFIDLDDYIEEKYGLKIPQIFASYGEKRFREMERDALKEIAAGEITESSQGCIIACGGGTPCFFDNIDLLNSLGTTVFLNASKDKLLHRLLEFNNTRPIVAGKNRDEISRIIESQMEKRLPFYSRAKIMWNSDSLESEEQIKANVSKFIASYPVLFQ